MIELLHMTNIYINNLEHCIALAESIIRTAF